MIETPVTGDVTSALAHLALVGLAAIVDSHTNEESRIWWTDQRTPRATLASRLGHRQIAEAVQAHAARAADDDSWLSARVRSGARAGSGLFTARAKVPSRDEWTSYLDHRWAMLRSSALTALDRRMIRAMGEPAWWREQRDQCRPDEGASRWEMKTRNRGEEFIVHRLAPLATTVAQRSAEKILSGLSGETQDDELGKNKPESRTSTGLTTPGPTDSVIAWCALWGLSVAPTIPRIGMLSKSPGMWPGRVLHPRRAALPVFMATPVSVSRFSQILTSGAFDAAAWQEADDEAERSLQLAPRADRDWLKEQGVHAIVRFPILKVGSPSAPERQIATGTLEVL